MEDALISPNSFSVLSGAGLVDATADKTIFVHTTETTEISGSTSGESSGGYIDSNGEYFKTPGDVSGSGEWKIKLENSPAKTGETDNIFVYVIPLDDNGDIAAAPIRVALQETVGTGEGSSPTDDSTLTITSYVFSSTYNFTDGQGVLVDYYTERKSGVKQIEITADKFAGSYYLEAACLWRDQSGVDYPAEFIIPNCKIQSNFTFSMAATGDPSTFTFTLDAFPGYLKFDKSKKVIAAIQVVLDEDGTTDVMSYQAEGSIANMYSPNSNDSTSLELTLKNLTTEKTPSSGSYKSYVSE